MIIESEKVDQVIEHLVNIANIPGVAIAVVSGAEIVFSNGYGYRELATKLPMTPHTLYPIASTTKAITATLLGILVEQGMLTWDLPLQNFLPNFQLIDRELSTRVTLRDLFAMRTGLPRHDWLWWGSGMTREGLVNRLRYLDLSAGFRELFQYNNILITTAGHIAETVVGRPWEDLVQTRILDPLGMTRTVFSQPSEGDVTRSYHEVSCGKLIQTKPRSTEVTGPSGGSIYSTVLDMAQWALFNLTGGQTKAGRQLIKPETLAELHFPQIVVGKDPAATSPHATYAMGWFVDTYNGKPRVSHSGHLHNVKSDVSLFPEDGIGFVSFLNVGAPVTARLVNQYVFDLLKGLQPVETVESVLERHGKRVEETRRRGAATRRVMDTVPSHPLDEYTGTYEHGGYGKVEVKLDDQTLILYFNEFVFPLEHWHYDAWVAQESDLFGLYEQHPFDRASRIMFESNDDGMVAALAIRLEPAVAPIRFVKQPYGVP